MQQIKGDIKATEDGRTPSQRWKFRRNLVIFIAAKNGASQRLLADVFDLPHSRIAAIIKEFRSKYDAETDRTN